MATPTKIILDKQSDLILTNARIVGASGIVKSDLPGLVEDLSNLTDSIEQENLRATTAEASLETSIETEKLRIDAILLGSTADLDQFVEIVNFVNEIDLENDTTLLSAVNNINNAIDAEASTRLAADNQLSSDLSDLQSYVDTTVDSAISTLTADLSSETASRISDVDAEESRATAAESSLAERFTNAITQEAADRFDADNELSSFISTEESARVAADASLTTALDAEASRATAAEGSLETSIETEKLRIDAILLGSTADLDTFVEIVNFVESIDLANDNSLLAAVTSINDAISLETLLRAGNDADLQSALNDETAARILAIQSEGNERAAGDAQLSSDLADETAARIADVDAEESRATAAELSLTDALGSEASRATAAELSLTTALGAEASRATAAEGSLETSIETEKLRIDAILLGSTADLDTFVEIVNFVNEIDLENDTTLLSAINSINDAIDAEESARIAADQALTADLSDLQSYVDTTVDSAISTLTADLSSEEGARVAADASLTTALGAEVLRATIAEESLTTLLNAEHSHHTLSEESLTTRLSVEESRAILAEESLTAVISVEHSHHTLAEESLDTKLSVEESRAIAAETQLGINIEEEESRATAAELSLTERVSVEESRAMSVDSSTEVRLSVEESRAIATEGSLEVRLSTEESRATVAESSLESDINTERLRIDAILAGSTADLDTFVEIVDFINSIDLNNDGELFTQLTQINQSIQAEIDRATGSEANLGTTIDGVSARVSTIEDTVANLPLTDGTTLEFDADNNVIKLKDQVAAPSTGYRTFDGLMKASQDPTTLTGADDLTYVTKGYVFGLVSAEAMRAEDVESDLDNRLTTTEDQLSNLSTAFDALPQVDGQTLEVNENNNTIRLREVVEAPESGIRTFQGLIHVESLPENNGMFSDNSLITRTYVNTSVANEYNRAFQAESDLANAISITNSNLDELTTYFEGIPGVDGVTIDLDTATNNIRLAADVAAPEGGIRTFGGLNKVAAEPSDNVDFDDLSLVTKGWVINQVGGDFQIALDAEISARIAGDASLDVRVQDIISNVDYTQIDSFSEIVSELSLEVARAEDAEMSLAADLSDLQSYVDTTVDSAISTLTADLDAEESRATAAELSLATDFANFYSQKVGVLGVPNGTLTTFSLTTPVRIQSEMIYVNGLLMEAGEDYTTIITDGKVSGIEFLVAPITEMKVRAYGVCNAYALTF
jgi:phosphoribosylcarboxyaminoimidazole (NCAIR) mutase